MQPDWPPDGKEIVFFGFSPGQKAKVYTISLEGGVPHEVIPEEPAQRVDP
jgi:hypothetical protein